MFLPQANSITIFLLIASFNCESKIISVSTSEQLKAALNEASPGDNISLSGNTTFPGTFIATRSGSRASPITIRTENFNETSHAKIVGEGNGTPALTMTGNYYNVENVKIVNDKSLGLLIEGTDITLEGVLIKNAERGVRIKGARNYLKDCYISEVKAGIELEGDFSIVRDTFVTGEGIVSLVAEKVTCCGTLMGNVFDGRVDIKGTDYNLFDNQIEGKSQ